MSFQVRSTVTGEGNSLTTVDFADRHFLLPPNAVWARLNEAEKQGALVAATQYVDLRFTGRLRQDVLEAEEVPTLLQTAVAEYAVRAAVGPLAPDAVVDATGASVVMTRKKIGPIEKEYEVVGKPSQSGFRSYAVPDGLIAKLLVARAPTRVIR